ncbi:MAG: TRAP transporter substrate-binding protein [Pyramidobacter sp.]
MKKLAALLLVGAVIGAASAAFAADYPEMTIRLSHNQPVGSPEDIGAETFKKLMEEKSGGKIVVEVFPQMQLGSMREQTEMVQMGTLEMAIQPTSVLTPFVEELSVIDFPFLWTDKDELCRIMDGEVGQKFYACCEAKGFKTLGLWVAGFKQITTAGKAVKTPDDLKGMKIRVMPSPQLVEQYRSWGANPIPIEYAELYNALQQHIVDGEENPIQSIALMKFYEVQDYLTITNHGFFGYLFIVNNRWFNKQSEEVQKLVVECEAAARMAERKIQASGEEKFLDHIRQSKIEVIELTPENREKFVQASLPLHAKFVEGSASKAELLKAVYEAKKAQ